MNPEECLEKIYRKKILTSKTRSISWMKMELLKRYLNWSPNQKPEASEKKFAELAF